MHIQTEIVHDPFRITLFGFGGPIEADGIGATGMRLMDRLWREVRGLGIQTLGINHWVYLPDSMMFTGVELADPTSGPGTLERLDVTLGRYVRHVHKGDYSTLPDVWPRLLAEIKDRGEVSRYPNLEIYGHWDADPSKCETTILIGLQESR